MADSSTVVVDLAVAFVLDLPDGVAVEFMEGEGVMHVDFFWPLFFGALDGILPSWTLLTDEAASAADLDDRVACGALEVGAAFLFDDNLPVKPSSSRLGVLRIT